MFLRNNPGCVYLGLYRDRVVVESRGIVSIPSLFGGFPEIYCSTINFGRATISARNSFPWVWRRRLMKELLGEAVVLRGNPAE